MTLTFDITIASPFAMAHSATNFNFLHQFILYL